MGKKIGLVLGIDQLSELDYWYKNGKSHAFRQRCRMVLLKAEGQSTLLITSIVGIKSQQQINCWIHRYQSYYATLGIAVLHNKKGQGRKQILDSQKDVEIVKELVKSERQRLNIAKDLLEKRLNKTFHINTLKHFLKNLSVDIKE